MHDVGNKTMGYMKISALVENRIIGHTIRR